MNFERLPNEILLDIFNYFPVVDLFQSFGDLNSRLSLLIVERLKSLSLDFHSVSRQNFNRICSMFLRSIVSHVHHIRLSNGDGSPKQIEDFLNAGFTWDQFSQLKTISICDLCSESILSKMVRDLLNLSMLTNLTIAGSYVRFTDRSYGDFIDRIWKLPSLKIFYLNSYSDLTQFIPPTISSTTIESVSIWGYDLTVVHFVSLLSATPRLKKISISLRADQSIDEIVRFPMMKRFQMISENCSEEFLRQILQMMPNLESLSLNLSETCVDGDQWKRLIRQYLPQLNRLKFLMSSNMADEQIIRSVLDSFQQAFWSKEHQWDVQCFIDRMNLIPTAYFMLSSLRIDFLSWTNSTEIFLDSIKNSPILCPTIRCLQLEIKISDGDRPIPVYLELNYVTHLIITIDQGIELSTTLLQSFCVMPRLRLLTIFSSSAIVSLQLLSSLSYNSAIRQLCLETRNQSFDIEHCTTLLQSPIVAQLQTLHINIRTRQSLTILHANLCHLSVLKIRCQDDPFEHEIQTDLSNIDDKFISWCQENLPNVYSISRDPVFPNDVQIVY